MYSYQRLIKYGPYSQDTTIPLSSSIPGLEADHIPSTVDPNISTISHPLGTNKRIQDSGKQHRTAVSTQDITDAWKQLGHMSTEHAQRMFLSLLFSILYNHV